MEDFKKIIDQYCLLVSSHYPSLINKWPVISGYNLTTFECDNWFFIIFHHRGPGSVMISNEEGIIPPSKFGVDEININNLSYIKEEILSIYAKSEKDMIISLPIIDRDNGKIKIKIEPSSINKELEEIFEKHKMILGLLKMKIFLSHKGSDKSLVRDYAMLLKELGFTTWFDEENAPAGSARNRVFSEGMAESCAAIFFITENFKDERDLGEEIDFALFQKRERGDKFAIIALCFQNGHVPDILKQRFIYKEPKNDVIALYEIVKALPIKVGKVEYKKIN